MAATQTFYLNAPSLSASTCVFIDIDLLVYAPDGFYSDGTIVRPQTNGVLGAAADVVCTHDCGVPLFGGDQAGVYNVIVDTGATTGAIIVRFDPKNFPKGLEATYKTVIYNEVSSFNDGYLAGIADRPTYLGDDDNDCGISGVTYGLTNYRYVNGAPVETSSMETVYVNPASLKMQADPPGDCVMVIPKTSSSITPEYLYIKVIIPCSGSDEFDLSIECPDLLPSLVCSSQFIEPDVIDPSGKACTLLIDDTCYYASASIVTAGDLAIHDVVFNDYNGVDRLADVVGVGYYRFIDSDTDFAWFQIDEHSIVISKGKCGA